MNTEAKFSFLLEICCDSVESAVRAQRGGADRIELCDCLDYGGITPSAGKIKITKELVNIPVFVLIRPRKGDFLYTEDEYKVMLEDIRVAKFMGADGIVSGVLLADGSIDSARTQQLVDASKPLDFTFHRAIDVTRYPVRSLQKLKEIGISRVLTSGSALNAVEGIALIKNMLVESENKIIIVVGGRVRPKTIPNLVAELSSTPQPTSIEFHSSASSMETSQMEFIGKIPMGSAESSEKCWRIVDEEIVREMKFLLRSFKPCK